MIAYKLVYLGGRVDYVYAASMEAAQAYARERFARLEAYVSPQPAIALETMASPAVDGPAL